jgi:SAM-dependent methyltransferase
MRDVPGSQLHGADVLPGAIELCHQTNPWCQFSLVLPLPPSLLPSGRFDVIYLYSVFSHLSEDAHAQWLDEFHRLLTPGGLLFATTWPRYYIELCERARGGDTRFTHPGSLNAFIGTSHWLSQYDAGEFCHSPVGGGEVLSRDFYGETCIPERYARRAWESRFRILDYIEADRNWLLQNLIVAQRP